MGIWRRGTINFGNVCSSVMMQGIFVTGTDTNVGKTVLAAALVQRLRAHRPVRYWKPIQTGIEQDDDTEQVVRLARCGPDEVFRHGVRLLRPVSPHLAAALSGRTIELPPLLDAMRQEADARYWIVEGAGGVLVPINDHELMIDFIVRLALPAVVAARSTLGTINHTLLTLEALRGRQVPIAGVVMTGSRDEHNRAAVERYGNVRVLGEMPPFDPLTPDALATWAASHLDPEGQLLR